MTAPEVQSASATIGGGTVNAVKQLDGSWQVDLSGEANDKYFTSMNIVADQDAKEATMSVTIGGTTSSRTVQFTNGVANVTIKTLLGLDDTGTPGVSVAMLRSINIINFTAELKDAANNKRTITIKLKLNP
ncbi:hypothetical protein JT05_11825 [Desulfosporosinus sp. Tol-M]|nr:hypothetical protein JT05_11825 [Desulfosporosinus sp. Tol-M]